MRTVFTYLNQQWRSVKKHRIKIFFFLLALLSALICLVASGMHYTGKAYGNHLTWIGWLSSMILFLLAFAPPVAFNLSKIPSKLKKLTPETKVLIGLSFFFLITHLWNFNTAPWNQNGLFDDASWNIYEAKKYIFSDEPFQGAFWRPGSSSAKGIVFHYYIMVLFYLFGFNVLTFNLSILALAFLTFLFTIKLIYKLFNSHFVSIISALALNFLPLHFIHAFVGQRYAVAPPLMMSSLYFLYTGFKSRSFFRIALSSILAGLCFAGAVMGKQYLIGLAGAVILYLIFDFKNTRAKTNRNLAACFFTGLLIASVPMLMYMYYNPVYFSLEGEYLNKFLQALRFHGFNGIKENIDRFYHCFFQYTWRRWFIPDFVLIPFAYYLLIIPGAIIAFLRKRYEYVAICAVSFVGAFIAGFSDYRVLMVCPLWFIFMAYALHAVTRLNLLPMFRYINYGIIIAILLAGLTPSIAYLNRKSKDPYSVHYFAQKDVAVSRILKDIVAGVPDPRPVLRKQEFQKITGYPEPDYETFICIEYGYAVPHTFLYDYDAEKILSFGGGIPFNLISDIELLEFNKLAIGNYQKNTKDLKLIWEKTPKSDGIIGKFQELNYLGYDQFLTFSHAGVSFTFYVLTIRNKNIPIFQEKVKAIDL